MLGEANVNLTPGSASRISEPGFFRLCFASAPSETVIEGVRRLGQVIC
jgi:DNA-binding transcriptional MocR family regulator